MHLNNGALTPECVVVTWTAAAAGLAVAANSLRSTEVNRNKLMEAAQLTGFVFVAQMVNVQLLPTASMHLVGSVLLAWRLGPALAMVSMSSILLAQAMLLGDGGLAAFGANMVNMAILPIVVTSLLLPRERSASRLALAGWISVVLASMAIPLQVNLWNPSFFVQMLSSHVVLGVFEAGITVLAASVMCRMDSGKLSRHRAIAFAILTTVLLLVTPISSPLPDGYESAAERTGSSSILTIEFSDIESVGLINLQLHTAQTGVANLVSRQIQNEFALALSSAFTAAVVCSLLGRTISGRNSAVEPA